MYLPILLLTASFLMVSCENLLDVESERYIFDEDHRMGSDHDSIYSIIGILSELNKLGDRYVLLGELRADLMETSEEASLYLKQLNDFTITKENPYASIKEYYSVINNCNYTIHFLDTTLRNKADKSNYRVMATAKAIRAWTYLQLVLNYGTANYLTKPILSAKDVNEDHEVVDLNTLCDYLIADLTPFASVEPMSMFLSLVPPVRLLLGECHLWKASWLEGQGQLATAKAHYASAAKAYYDLIKEEELIVSKANSNTWSWNTKTGMPNDSLETHRYGDEFSATSIISVVSAMISSTEVGKPFTIDSLTYKELVVPSAYAIKHWDEQLYFYSETGLTDGDLRARDSYKTFSLRNDEGETVEHPTIWKYIYMSEVENQKMLILYRMSHVYLHYAEAVNRLGYPQLAYETMKSGLNSTTMAKPNVRAEVYDTTLKAIPEYLDFTAFQFSNNVGTKMRGLGNVNRDTTYYIIPKNEADPIAWVEDALVSEYALECAFEGSRFHDLMRVAIRRNDPAFLANQVAQKHTTNKELIRSKLMNRANWYLPK